MQCCTVQNKGWPAPLVLGLNVGGPPYWMQGLDGRTLGVGRGRAFGPWSYAVVNSPVEADSGAAPPAVNCGGPRP